MNIKVVFEKNNLVSAKAAGIHKVFDFLYLIAYHCSSVELHHYLQNLFKKLEN